MAIWFVLLTSGAYLLGSVPASYLAARLFRGIDLRQCGTGQVGAGNLWRMTSWKLGLPVGLFDLSKGLAMVLVAKSAGLDVSQQLAAGLAVIAGHNWPLFLRFNGGRGISTTMGVIFILPLINDVTRWTLIAFFVLPIIGALILRSSPLPVLAGAALLPVVSWAFHDPLPVILGYLAVFLVIVIKRLTVPRSADAASVGQRHLLLNRLFFDRDISDKRAWMYRKPAKQA